MYISLALFDQILVSFIGDIGDFDINLQLIIV